MDPKDAPNAGTVTVSITGYRQLSEQEQDLINVIKINANLIGELVDRLNGDKTLDPRWVAIGKTHLQQGFMALTRAVAQPTSF